MWESPQPATVTTAVAPAQTDIPATSSTAVPTDTVAATAAPSVSVTPVPSDTPVLAGTLAPTATPQPMVAGAANLRDGPGTNYPVVGRASAGQALEIVASDAARIWFELKDGSWISGQLVQNAPRVQVETNIPAPPAPTHTPVPPPPPAPPASVSQQLVGLTSPIAHGAYATITVRTQPGINCSITVYYMSGASTAQELGPEVAGADGICSWTWKVGTRTTPGTWSIVVTTGSVTNNYPFVVQ
jgi:hypothetical protein